MLLPAVHVCALSCQGDALTRIALSLPVILLFTLACGLLGYRVIAAVPPLLHTPLMSGMNALSGITLLAALALVGSLESGWGQALAAASGTLAAVNVTGGFWVTERMLRMFKRDVKNNNEVQDHD